MEEDESFDEFYAKLKDIVNSAFNLGETILEPKIVRKVLRSLPEKFHAKITAIEESKDIDKIPLTELVSNLQTYELGLSRIGKSGKGKSMALKAKSSDTDESSNRRPWIFLNHRPWIFLSVFWGPTNNSVLSLSPYMGS